MWNTPCPANTGGGMTKNTDWYTRSRLSRKDAHRHTQERLIQQQHKPTYDRKKPLQPHSNPLTANDPSHKLPKRANDPSGLLESHLPGVLYDELVGTWRKSLEEEFLLLLVVGSLLLVFPEAAAAAATTAGGGAREMCSGRGELATPVCSAFFTSPVSDANCRSICSTRKL